MSETFIYTIGKEAIVTAVMVAAPVLVISLIVGLLISIFQAVTQIQEQTLTFVPKLIVVILLFLILGPWMMQELVQFTQNMINNITLVVR